MTRHGNWGFVEASAVFLTDQDAIALLREVRVLAPKAMREKTGMLPRLPARREFPTKEVLGGHFAEKIKKEPLHGLRTLPTSCSSLEGP